MRNVIYAWLQSLSPAYLPAADAALFAGDADLDKNAVAEIFMFVAGVSTLVFGLSTDLPFLVAPSVLYVARETGYV